MWMALLCHGMRMLVEECVLPNTHCLMWPCAVITHGSWKSWIRASSLHQDSIYSAFRLNEQPAIDGMCGHHNSRRGCHSFVTSKHARDTCDDNDAAGKAF